MEQVKKRISRKPLRNRKIFEDYQQLLKEDIPRVKFTSKSYYYVVLGEKWGLDEKTVGKIINHELRNHNN